MTDSAEVRRFDFYQALCPFDALPHLLACSMYFLFFLVKSETPGTGLHNVGRCSKTQEHLVSLLFGFRVGLFGVGTEESGGT